MNESQVSEMRGLLTEIKTVGETNRRELDKLRNEWTDIQKSWDSLDQNTRSLRKHMLARGNAATGPRPRGRVSDECAKELAAMTILNLVRHNKLEAFCSDATQRSAWLTEARQIMGIAQKTALTTSDVPLPTTYFSELRELISEFGVVRNAMFPFPLGPGTSKPPRMGTRPAFGSIAMSAAFPEKSPTITFASLESHKLGGVVISPREIEEQSIVQYGQWLARYGAVELARAEDTWGFLADGSATYEQVKGIVQISRDNSRYRRLGASKTSPSDTTKNDIRQLRTNVNKAALSARRSAYYLDSSWESKLGDFNTQSEPNFYRRNPDGSAVIDGYPVVWTDVLTAYQEGAVPDAPLMVFGALEFWWFGERGMPRIDISADVFFVNDQIATRFIEEIDFDYAALDAAAVLLTAVG